MEATCIFMMDVYNRYKQSFGAIDMRVFSMTRFYNYFTRFYFAAGICCA